MRRRHRLQMVLAHMDDDQRARLRAHLHDHCASDRPDARAHHPGGPGFGFGPRGGFGGFGGPGGSRRRRRGETRLALLRLLAEAPRHGYALMQELEERSDGQWRPSAGSIYPTLEQLSDEGLVRSSEQDGRRIYELTDDGRAALETRSDEPDPWASPDGEQGAPQVQLGKALKAVAIATRQVMQAGSPAQQQAAMDALEQTRRSLYGILADGDVD